MPGDLEAMPREPMVLPLQWAVWLLVGVMTAIELVLSVVDLAGAPGGVGGRLWALSRFAYAAEIQSFMIENRVVSWANAWRYVTFSFVQPGTLPALLALVMLAALGKQVAQGLGAAGFWAVAMIGPALAALVFGLIAGPDPMAWMAGGFAMVFALVGAFTWLLWDQRRGERARQWRAFGLIGVLLAGRLAMGVIVEAGLAWVADLAAFLCGFALAVLIHPEGRARLIARARGRG